MANSSGDKTDKSTYQITVRGAVPTDIRHKISKLHAKAILKKVQDEVCLQVFGVDNPRTDLP